VTRFGRPTIEPGHLRAVLGQVQDPELALSLDSLGMLGEVTVGRSGTVGVQLRLTTPTCPMVDELRTALGMAAATVDGVQRVEVEITAMPPRERAELAERLGRARHPVAGGMFGSAPQVLAVASGKGGVGKSTVTANLAVALASGGRRVGVLDADVWGYSIPQLFGVRRSPVVLGELMLPVPAYGVHLISMGFFVTEDQPVVWRGPMLHKALEQFIGDTLWPELDVLLVDLPPGTGDATLSVLGLLPQAQLLVVTTPQDAARTVAARVTRMAAETSGVVGGVIENMSGTVCPHCGESSSPFGSGGGALLAEQADAPLLGQVPLEAKLRIAGDDGAPLAATRRDGPAGRAFHEIAGRLPRPPRRSLVGRSLPLTVVQS
jgi:ATP-binding protein involved in chromosome partitioning